MSWTLIYVNARSNLTPQQGRPISDAWTQLKSIGPVLDQNAAQQVELIWVAVHKQRPM